MIGRRAQTIARIRITRARRSDRERMSTQATAGRWPRLRPTIVIVYPRRRCPMTTRGGIHRSAGPLIPD
jgi:hypothetical protein